MLKQILVVQKLARLKEKVHLLYLLKTECVETVTEAAHLIGRNRSTVQQWLQVYRHRGIEGLLEEKHSPGRPRAIPEWAENALKKQLQSQTGFKDYQEIVVWLDEALGIKAEYKTVHKLVHYRLKTSPRASKSPSIE